MRKYCLIVPVYTFFLLTPILTICRFNPALAASPTTYFSSGQAVYDPQDHAKSQQQAIHDFMVQGLTQAISSFLSPTQMGAQFSEIQQKVLSKPAKYIASYQVFSEEQSGGVFRVVGQVTVSIEALREDLVKSGLLAAQQNPPAAPAPSTEVGVAAPATENENTQEEENIESSEEPNESHTSAPQSMASQPQVIERGAGEPASRGIFATKGEILWAVAEKWEQEWVLPSDSSDLSSLFARSLGKEMDDFDFSIHLPQPGREDGSLGQYPPIAGDFACRGAWHPGCGGRQGFLHAGPQQQSGVARRQPARDQDRSGQVGIRTS